MKNIFDIETACLGPRYNPLVSYSAGANHNKELAKLESEKEKLEDEIITLTRKSSIETRQMRIKDLDILIESESKKKPSGIPDKAGLNPMLSIVCHLCISDTETGIVRNFSARTLDQESDLLNELVIASQFDSEKSRIPTGWAGFNIKGFDIPFLISRMSHHGFYGEAMIMFERFKYSEHVLDLMDVFSGNLKYVAQKEVCIALGIDSQPEEWGGGDKVQGLFDAGRMSDIQLHCQADVWQCKQMLAVMGVMGETEAGRGKPWNKAEEPAKDSDVNGLTFSGAVKKSSAKKRPDVVEDVVPPKAKPANNAKRSLL